MPYSHLHCSIPVHDHVHHAQGSERVSGCSFIVIALTPEPATAVHQSQRQAWVDFTCNFPPPNTIQRQLDCANPPLLSPEPSSTTATTPRPSPFSNVLPSSTLAQLARIDRGRRVCHRTPHSSVFAILRRPATPSHPFRSCEAQYSSSPCRTRPAMTPRRA